MKAKFTLCIEHVGEDVYQVWLSGDCVGTPGSCDQWDGDTWEPGDAPEVSDYTVALDHVYNYRKNIKIAMDQKTEGILLAFIERFYAGTIEQAACQAIQKAARPARHPGDGYA